MAVKILVSRRIFQLRKTIQVDTQQVCVKTIRQLEELFDIASAIARGKIQWQLVEGKKQPISLPQRQKWARVAAYIAQIINTISKNVDERRIDLRLDKLE